MADAEVREQRVVVVDPDAATAEVVASFLSTEGLSVVVVGTSEEALTVTAEQHVDLVILGLLLSRYAGLDLIRDLRAILEVPIIVVTSRASETDLVLALELGADDVLVKPFNPHELLARVRAVLRRTRCTCGATRGGASAPPTTNLEVDREAYQARRKGRPIALTPTEFRILEVLTRRPGQIFTRAQLLEAFASEANVYDRTLDKHIANLRKKIEEFPARPQHLLTVFGVGYKYTP